jgi:SAM-dependent methyltransferase
MPLPDGAAAAVTVAQAFHWFRVDEALSEIHRVLATNGRMALLWNVRDERVDWVQRITEIIDPYAQGSGVGIPRFRNRDWQPALDRTPGFVKVAENAFAWEQPMDAEGLAARIESTSFISVLPAERKAIVLDQVRELAATHPSLKESFGFPYVTEVTVFEATATADD